MSSTVSNIRQSIKRRFSHKDKELPLDDDVSSADEETADIVNKEVSNYEKDESNPYGKQGSLVHRLITHGNKKTEEQIAKDAAEAEAAKKARAQALGQ